MRYLFSILLVFCFYSVSAQNSDTLSGNNDEAWTLKESKKCLKFSPLDIVSILPTFGADVEVFKNDRHSFQVGIGLIPNFSKSVMSQFLFNGDRMWGYKLRAEGRYYFPVKTNRYFALGFSFRHLMIKDEMIVGREPFTNEWGGVNFVYFESVSFTANRLNLNLDFKYGFQQIKTEGYVLDLYVGVSLRSIVIRSNAEIQTETQFVPSPSIWGITQDYNFNYPTPIAGVKIGFSN